MEQIGARRGAADRRAHAVAVVLDHVDDRQLPQRGHVEAFGDLALIDRAVAEIADGDRAVPAIAMGKGQARADRHRGADDPMAAKEILLAAEHVHRAALAVRIAAAPPGQLGHDAFRVHAAGQHMAVVAIGRDGGVAFLERRLHAGDHRFLADVEVAEPADQPHPVHLAGPLLEAADQQHLLEKSLERRRSDRRLRELQRTGRPLRWHKSIPPGLRAKHVGKWCGLQPAGSQFSVAKTAAFETASIARRNG